MKRARRSRAEAAVAAAALVAVAVDGADMVAAVDGAAAIVEIVATAVIAAIAGNESFLQQAVARMQPLQTCLFSVSAIALPKPGSDASGASVCHRDVNRRQLSPQ
jgi:hypothetical protein